MPQARALRNRSRPPADDAGTAHPVHRFARAVAVRDVLPAVPHAVDAERVVLGACLLDGRRVRGARLVLGPEHFGVAVHRGIWGAALALADEGVPVTILSVAAFLDDDAVLAAAGGVVFLSRLLDEIPRGGVRVRWYADRIREAALRREGRRLFAEMGRRILDDDPAAVADAAISGAMGIADTWARLAADRARMRASASGAREIAEEPR